MTHFTPVGTTADERAFMVMHRSAAGSAPRAIASFSAPTPAPHIASPWAAGQNSGSSACNDAYAMAALRAGLIALALIAVFALVVIS